MFTIHKRNEALDSRISAIKSKKELFYDIFEDVIAHNFIKIKSFIMSERPDLNCDISYFTDIILEVAKSIDDTNYNTISSEQGTSVLFTVTVGENGELYPVDIMKPMTRTVDTVIISLSFITLNDNVSITTPIYSLQLSIITHSIDSNLTTTISGLYNVPINELIYKDNIYSMAIKVTDGENYCADTTSVTEVNGLFGANSEMFTLNKKQTIIPETDLVSEDFKNYILRVGGSNA